MATLLQDTFTGTDGTDLISHTMDVGPGWVRASNVGTERIQISGNQAKAIGMDGGATTRCGYVAESGAADCTISATCTDVLAGNEVGLIFRYQDYTTFFKVTGYQGDGKAYLYEVAPGVNNVRASGGTGVTLNTPFTLSVVLAGTSITVKINGVTACTYTASTCLTNTKHGIQSFQVNNLWDNFLVSSAPTTQQGQAGLAARTTLTAKASVLRSAKTNLGSSSLLLAAGKLFKGGIAGLASRSILSALGTKYLQGRSALTARTLMVATAIKFKTGVAHLQSSATLVGTGVTMKLLRPMCIRGTLSIQPVFIGNMQISERLSGVITVQCMGGGSIQVAPAYTSELQVC